MVDEGGKGGEGEEPSHRAESADDTATFWRHFAVPGAAFLLEAGAPHTTQQRPFLRNAHAYTHNATKRESDTQCSEQTPRALAAETQAPSENVTQCGGIHRRGRGGGGEGGCQ